MSSRVYAFPLSDRDDVRSMIERLDRYRTNRRTLDRIRTHLRLVDPRAHDPLDIAATEVAVKGLLRIPRPVPITMRLVDSLPSAIDDPNAPSRTDFYIRRFKP